MREVTKAVKLERNIFAKLAFCTTSEGQTIYVETFFIFRPFQHARSEPTYHRHAKTKRIDCDGKQKELGYGRKTLRALIDELILAQATYFTF